MPNLTGPLFSLDARGQLGKSLIYAKCRGSNYAKAYATPSNPNTLPQLAQRRAVKYITQRWATLSSPEKESWLELATPDPATWYHAYLKYNLHRWRNQHPPCARLPQNDFNTIDSEQFDLFYGGNGWELSASATAAILEQRAIQLCWCEYLDTEPANANTVALLPLEDVGGDQYDFNGLIDLDYDEPASWYYRYITPRGGFTEWLTP